MAVAGRVHFSISFVLHEMRGSCHCSNSIHGIMFVIRQENLLRVQAASVKGDRSGAEMDSALSDGASIYRADLWRIIQSPQRNLYFGGSGVIYKIPSRTGDNQCCTCLRALSLDE